VRRSPPAYLNNLPFNRPNYIKWKILTYLLHGAESFLRS
jgi:hypothetical protein